MGALTESTDQYRQTLMSNNDLLKRGYPEEYELITGMEVERLRKSGTSAKGIAAYEKLRAEKYDRMFKGYCVKIDSMVEPLVKRYADNIGPGFGGTDVWSFVRYRRQG